MQITSKFTIAIHIITAIDYFGDTMKVTSSFLAGSVGANPVIVRNVMGNLKAAGLIETSQGKSGIRLARKLDEITFYDVYRAVECVDDRGLFHFHENPSIRCPVGRNIHRALDGKLRKVQDAMEAELRRITVADVESDIRKEVAAGH
ncbi:Rrf2 family transcriptional regulator [Dialister sp.]|jgi:DNA-binding IscR family transcriptional regulator|uniref:Rrf2 family transcriptional regulator n=1 Tax=Dialister sp. TaxID=1955814 RepID=UPI0025F9C2AD|nr:Rrf2 family transcriptional regulator [Dialister sp.]